MLAGQRYEILPVGGGRWMWRHEYDQLISTTSSRPSDSRQVPASLTDDDENDTECHVNNVTPNAAAAAETTRIDDVDNKLRQLDDVSAETRDVSTQWAREWGVHCDTSAGYRVGCVLLPAVVSIQIALTSPSGFYHPKSGIKIGSNFPQFCAEFPPISDSSFPFHFGLIFPLGRKFC